MAWEIKFGMLSQVCALLKRILSGDCGFGTLGHWLMCGEIRDPFVSAGRPTPFLFMFCAAAISSYLVAQQTGLWGLIVGLRLCWWYCHVLEGMWGQPEDIPGGLGEILCCIPWKDQLAQILWFLDRSCTSTRVAAWRRPQWIPKGTAFRYLGCQVELDISSEQSVSYRSSSLLLSF